MSQLSTLVSLFNQARPGYLFAELLAVREALIGSQTLINLIESGSAPESLEVAICETTKTQVDPSVRPHQDSLVIINEYVTQIAAGDAILRSRQQLPPAPTCPGQVIGAFKQSKYAQPDYKPLWEYVEREKASGGLDAAWEDGFGNQSLPWRTRLTKVLKLLNDRYFDLIASQAVLFEGEDGLFKCTQEVLDEAVATVKPLSVPAATGSNSPSAALKRSYLEELRSRGASAVFVLGRYAKEEGNKHVKRGDAVKEGGLIKVIDRRGEPPVPPRPEQWMDRTWAYMAASFDYGDAARVSEHSAVALCNMAALHLKTKDYDLAWQSCQSALESLTRIEHGAPTLGGKRASCVRAIATGYTPKVPAGIKPPRTAAANKEMQTIAWKSQVRFAKAHCGMMQDKMKKNEHPSKLKHACDMAIGAYDQALLIDPSDPLPKKEQAVVLSLFNNYQQRWGK